MILVQTNSVTLTNRFKASIYFLAKNEGGRSKPVTGKYIQQLFSKTWSIACRVDLGLFLIKTRLFPNDFFVDKDVEMIMPGEHGNVELTLLTKMVMMPGQTFTIRENKVTVATGIITETLPSVVIVKNLGKLEVG